MADNEIKIRKLLALGDPELPTLETLRGLRPMTAQPWTNVLRAQDSILGGARRVLVTNGIRGQSDFGVPGADPGETGSQEAPEPDHFVEVGRHRTRLTPGSFLGLRVVYFPSGGTQQQGALTWIDYGNRATVRVTATWDKGANLSQATWSVELEGEGAAPTDAGDYVRGLRRKSVSLLWPPELAGAADEQLKYSEWSELEVVVEYAGGARVVDLCAYEQPVVHVQDHDTTEPQSAHAYVLGGVVPATPPTTRPQTKAPDGATYDEQRFGALKGLEVAERQQDRLGPRILSVSTHHPTTYDYTADDLTPIQVQSATFVDVFDPSRTSWDADNPGWLCAGANAKLYGHNDPMAGKVAVVPVRVYVRAEWNDGGGNPGVVRVQSSPYEYVDVEFGTDATLETNEAIGWLATQVYGDQPNVANVQVLAHSGGASDTLDIYAVDVDFGHWTEA